MLDPLGAMMLMSLMLLTVLRWPGGNITLMLYCSPPLSKSDAIVPFVAVATVSAIVESGMFSSAARLRSTTMSISGEESVIDERTLMRPGICPRNDSTADFDSTESVFRSGPYNCTATPWLAPVANERMRLTMSTATG